MKGASIFFKQSHFLISIFVLEKMLKKERRFLYHATVCGDILSHQSKHNGVVYFKGSSYILASRDLVEFWDTHSTVSMSTIAMWPFAARPLLWGFAGAWFQTLTKVPFTDGLGFICPLLNLHICLGWSGFYGFVFPYSWNLVCSFTQHINSWKIKAMLLLRCFVSGISRLWTLFAWRRPFTK